VASPLVNRYADLAKKPLDEVEGFWRAAKKRANESGRKGHWPTVLGFFKESLNLSEADGRLVYFHEAPAEILAETPSFALIRVLDDATVDESLKKLVEASKGLITVNYEHLFNQPNKAPIGYPYQREALGETTTSMAVPSAPMVRFGSGRMLVPGLTVKHKGRSAMVCYSGPKETKIQYLNDKGMLMGEEASVPHTELSIKRSSIYEEAESIWTGMDTALTLDQKKVGLREILKLEHRLEHVPEPLIEAVVKSFSATGANKVQTTLQITDSDWAIVFSKDEESDEVEAVKDNPLPKKPPEDKPKPDATAAPAPGTASKSTTQDSGAREPSEAEIRSMISKVREDRRSINLTALSSTAERAAATQILTEKGEKVIANLSREQRLAARANQWDELLGNK
jgi:hypothetical protein